MFPAPKGVTSKHSNGCAHVPGLALARMKKKMTGWHGRTPYRCADHGLLQALAGGLRSDLGIESPSLQSSCRSWMDDA